MQKQNISNEAGIYRILNTVTGKYYIGSANNFRKRYKKHINQLRNNKHHSIYLQRSFNKHGEDLFIFEVVETIPKDELIDNTYLIDVEQIWLDTYQPYRKENGYNICPTAGSCKGIKHTAEN